MLRRSGLILIIIVSIFWPLQVMAQEISSNGSSRDQRLSQDVIDQKMVISAAERAMIITKCQTVQNKLEIIENGLSQQLQQRIDTYSNIQQQLQAVKLRMMRQGADASEADLLTGEIQQALNNFTIQANNYGTALDDLVNVNCQQNPEEFEAGLVVMRQQRAELLKDASSLKSIIDSSYNGIFEQLKDRLVS